jgi:hypothetical protein
MFDEYSSELTLPQSKWQTQRYSELQTATTDLHSYSEHSATEEAEFRCVPNHDATQIDFLTKVS